MFSINTRNYLSYLELDRCFIAWNRFYPSLLVFNKSDFHLILSVVDNLVNVASLDDDFRESLYANHFLFNDYSRKYLSEMNSFLEKIESNMLLFIHNQNPYRSIQIYNEECNLNCPYCVMKFTWGKKKTERSTFSHDAIYKRIIDVIEQQRKALKRRPKENFMFSFNGGEVLMRFNIIKNIILYLRDKPLTNKTEISINTNATLIDDSIAKFCETNEVEIHLSIDCNKEHHDMTRIYHCGKGSFDDVVKNYLLLKKYDLPDDCLNTFQGTMDQMDLINKAEFLNLSRYGFKGARISANLFNISLTEGKKRAEQYFRIVKASQKRKLKIIDTNFRNYERIINNGINSCFFPYCNGLGATSNLGLCYNMSNDSFSFLCQFVPEASVRISKNENIFNLKIAKNAISFIKNRLKSIEENCMKCELIGVCRGGCVMEGLTAFNDINEGACGFIKQLWCLYVAEVYRAEKEKDLSYNAATS